MSNDPLILRIDLTRNFLNGLQHTLRLSNDQQGVQAALTTTNLVVSLILDYYENHLPSCDSSIRAINLVRIIIPDDIEELRGMYPEIVEKEGFTQVNPDPE